MSVDNPSISRMSAASPLPVAAPVSSASCSTRWLSVKSVSRRAVESTGQRRLFAVGYNCGLIPGTGGTTGRRGTACDDPLLMLPRKPMKTACTTTNCQ